MLLVLSGQQCEQAFVRAGDDVGRDDFAERARGLCAGVHRRFHGGHVASHDDRHVGGSDFFFADQLDIGGLEHRVCGFEYGCESLGFQDSDGLVFVHGLVGKIRRAQFVTTAVKRVDGVGFGVEEGNGRVWPRQQCGRCGNAEAFRLA